MLYSNTHVTSTLACVQACVQVWPICVDLCSVQVPSRVVGVVNYMLNVWNKDLNSCTHS